MRRPGEAGVAAAADTAAHDAHGLRVVDEVLPVTAADTLVKAYLRSGDALVVEEPLRQAPGETAGALYLKAFDAGQYQRWLEGLPGFRSMASVEAFNAVLDAIAGFRRVHFGWAEEYIHQHTDDSRGTGGTPYMEWLQQLIKETLDYRK